MITDKSFADSLKKAIIDTINSMGIDEFKKISWFASNTKESAIYTEIDDGTKKFLSDVEGLVEANRYEQYCIWREECEIGDITWKDIDGIMGTCGMFGGMPITISLRKVKMDDHVILFYYSPSMVTHYEIMEKWLRHVMPESAKRKDGYLNKTDSGNFINVIFDIERRKKKKTP